MVGAWHGHGMASVNHTRPHCVNQIGKTHSKPLAARHGKGTAWARHAMCESALKDTLHSFPSFIVQCTGLSHHPNSPEEFDSIHNVYLNSDGSRFEIRRETFYIAEARLDLTQSFHVNSRIATKMKPRPLPSASLPIH